MMKQNQPGNVPGWKNHNYHKCSRLEESQLSQLTSISVEKTASWLIAGHLLSEMEVNYRLGCPPAQEQSPWPWLFIFLDPGIPTYPEKNLKISRWHLLGGLVPPKLGHLLRTFWNWYFGTPVALVSLPYPLSNGDPGVEWTTTRRRFGWDVCGWLGGLLEAGGVFFGWILSCVVFFPVSLGVDLGCTSIMHLTLFIMWWRLKAIFTWCLQ